MNKKIFLDIQHYIDKNFADELRMGKMKYSFSEEPIYEKACASFEKIPLPLEESFSTKLLSLIDKTGLSDPDVYKRAGIDRKLFSKIRSNSEYKPSKNTAISFSLALKLGLDDTLDLLKSAGFTLSNSSKFDLIIKFFIEKKTFDLFKINEALHEFEQPVLNF